MMQYVPLGQLGRLRFETADRNGSAIAPTTMGTITLRSRSPLGVEVAQGTPGEAVSIVTEETGVYTAQVDTSDASLQASEFFKVAQVIGGTMAGLIVDGETLSGHLDDEFTIVSAVEAPDDPELCGCWFVAIGADGEAEVGAAFQVALIDGDDTAGYAYDTTPRDLVSGVDGMVQFFALRGKRYEYWPGVRRHEAVPFTVPDEATFAVPELVGDF